MGFPVSLSSINLLPSGSIEATGPFRIGGLTDNTTFEANGSITQNGAAKITANQYNLAALNTEPANASATGTLGEIRITANYIYVCTATNTWKRAALSTW